MLSGVQFVPHGADKRVWGPEKNKCSSVASFFKILTKEDNCQPLKSRARTEIGVLCADACWPTLALEESRQ